MVQGVKPPPLSVFQPLKKILFLCVSSLRYKWSIMNNLTLPQQIKKVHVRKSFLIPLADNVIYVSMQILCAKLSFCKDYGTMLCQHLQIHSQFLPPEYKMVIHNLQESLYCISTKCISFTPYLYVFFEAPLRVRPPTAKRIITLYLKISTYINLRSW